MYRFKAIPIKIPGRFFIDIDKVTVKCIWKGKGTRIIKAILKKENKVKEICPTDFKTYHRATLIQTVMSPKGQTYINGTKQKTQK